MHLEKSDDLLHPPGPEAAWRESFFFGFHDEAGWSGLTYISVSPYKGVAERIVLLLKPGEDNLVSIQRSELAAYENAVLEQGSLGFHCLEPLRNWQISADVDGLAVPSEEEITSVLTAGRVGSEPTPAFPISFDLDFVATMPAYRFPDKAWDFLGPDQQHFEQMGRGSGRLRIGGRDLSFDGFICRDRSWGVRDWLRSNWYNWINLRFDEGFCLGVALSQVDGREASTGYVFEEGRFHQVVEVAVDARRDPRNLHVLGGQVRIVTTHTQVFNVEVVPQTFCHLAVARTGESQDHDCVTLVSCVCQGREGRGFLEYARNERIDSPSSTLW